MWDIARSGSFIPPFTAARKSTLIIGDTVLFANVN
jgi:hypothetical protein